MGSTRTAKRPFAGGFEVQQQKRGRVGCGDGFGEDRHHLPLEETLHAASTAADVEALLEDAVQNRLVGAHENTPIGQSAAAEDAVKLDFADAARHLRRQRLEGDDTVDPVPQLGRKKPFDRLVGLGRGSTGISRFHAKAGPRAGRRTEV